MLDKKWFLKHQRLLLLFANTFIGRYVLRLGTSSIGKNKIIAILPNSIYWIEKGKYKAEFRTHDKYAKRIYYTFYRLFEILHLWDMVWYPKFNLGYDTLGPIYPAAGANSPCDGYVRRTGVDEAFATIRAGAGTDFNVTDANNRYSQLIGSATNDQYTLLVRSIFTFDTSPLTAPATISAAVFSLNGDGKSNGLGSPTFDIVAATPAATNTLANGDFSQLGTTVFADVAYASYNTAGYNDFNMDANGIANISKTTVTKYGTRLGWDTDNSFGGVWANGGDTYFNGYYADQAGTANDPKLVVTYTLPTGGFFIMF